MSVFNLPSTINAAGFAGYTLRTGQTSTDAYYDQDGTSTAALRFNISNNNLTFYVNGPGTSGQPSSWTLNGTSASDGDIIVQNDDIVINESGTTGSFTVGNWLTAASGGGGGGSFLGGGPAGPSGSITRFGSSITWSIDQNSPSSSPSDSYYLKLNNTIYYPNGITHSNGQHTTVTITTQVGTWILWHEDQNGGTSLAELTVLRLGKTFCNFW